MPGRRGSCRILCPPVHSRLALRAIVVILIAVVTAPAIGQGFDLHAAIANARDGDTIQIPAGRYSGPIVIDKAISLVARENGVIEGNTLEDVLFGIYLKIVVLAFSLALAMLSVGTLVSVMCKKASTATGAAIFLWLALVFLGDLGLMGSTIAFKLQVADLFQLSLLNPMQVFKMSAIGSINVSLDVLGPAGLYAINTYGARLPLLLAAALGGWIILPLVASLVLFTRRSIS